MKILISGGSGFIGKNLVNYLNKKNKNIMIIGRNLDFINSKNIKKKFLDLNKLDSDYQDIIDYNPDIFIHLAWEGLPDHSEKISKRNYINTIRIIKMIINSTSCSKIIITGSCWEYNDGNVNGDCKEDLKIKLNTPFSIYKNKIFKEVYHLTKEKNIIFNWLRLFYVYGYGQRKKSIIPMLIDSIKNKKKIEINFPSNLNDYINVKDVVKIIDNFINKKIKSGIYNVGSGKGIEVKELLKIIDFNINKNNKFTKEYLNQIDEKKKFLNFYANTKKLNKYINNFKLIGTKEGIKDLIKKY